MILLRSLILSLIVLSASAFAEGEMSNSELLWQPESGNLALTPGIFVYSTIYSYRNLSGLDGNTTSVPLHIGADYGISSLFSVGLDLAYKSARTSYTSCPSGYSCTGSSSKGVEDPTLNAKLRLPLGPGLLRLGADLSFALEKAKYTSSGDSNAATGGTTFTPFVAYEVTIGRNTFGGRVTYDLYKGDQKVQDDRLTASSYKITGGNSLGFTLFYENQITNKFKLGGYVGYSSQNESQTKVDGSSTGSPDHDNGSVTSFVVYTPVTLNERITLLPITGYATLDYPGSSSVSSAGTLYLGFSTRFIF